MRALYLGADWPGSLAARERAAGMRDLRWKHSTCVGSSACSIFEMGSRAGGELDAAFRGRAWALVVRIQRPTSSGFGMDRLSKCARGAVDAIGHVQGFTAKTAVFARGESLGSLTACRRALGSDPRAHRGE